MQDNFMFFLEVTDFFFGFYYQEFDQGLKFSLNALRLVDRSAIIKGQKPSEVAKIKTFTPDIDDTSRF